MAHAITLTDGTTTVNLFSLTGTFPTTWSLGAPEEDRDTIGEAIDLLIQATSIANLQTAVRQIETLLHDAVRRERTRVGARVFLTVQWDGEAQVWRSEVVSGRLEMHGAAEQYSRLKIEATLGITRRTYWEGPETALSLSNDNGSGTGGINVYSVNDGVGTSPTKRNNYLQIAGASVTGSLPGPVKLELTKLTTGTRVVNDLYLANNAYSDPANLSYILEAESRVWGGTITADAACSGGSKNVFSAYGTSVQTYWSLSSSTLQKTLGRWFRVLVSLRSRTATAAQAETMQAHITDTTGTHVLYTGPEVSVNERGTAGYPLVDLGAFPLPPGNSAVSFGALQLWITLRIVSGTATTAIDYLQLTPTDAFVPLRLYPIGMLLNDVLLYDGIDGASYATANGGKGPFVRTASAPLMVYPGQLQRLMLQHCSDGTALDINEYWNAKAWYWRRRLSI